MPIAIVPILIIAMNHQIWRFHHKPNHSNHGPTFLSTSPVKISWSPHVARFIQHVCMWRFPKMWVPYSWMVYFMDNPTQTWMILGYLSSDQEGGIRSIWGIHISLIFPMHWRAVRSYQSSFPTIGTSIEVDLHLFVSWWKRLDRCGNACKLQVHLAAPKSSSRRVPCCSSMGTQRKLEPLICEAWQ